MTFDLALTFPALAVLLTCPAVAKLRGADVGGAPEASFKTKRFPFCITLSFFSVLLLLLLSS